MEEPIGVSAIDLMVCVFIAMVALYLLNSPEPVVATEAAPVVELLTVEVPRHEPVYLLIRVGDASWVPGERHSNAFSYTLDASQPTHVTHRLVMRLPANKRDVALCLYAVPEKLVAGSVPKYAVRIDHIAADGRGMPRQTKPELNPDNYYRHVVEIRK